MVKPLDEAEQHQRDGLKRDGLKRGARRLVLELGSYSAAARQLGMTRQAVHYLVGPGVADGRRVAVLCVDCGRQMVTQGELREHHCRRCSAYLKRTDHRWSVERAKRSRRRSHCQRGHPLDDANIYITPAGRRECRVCIKIRLERHKAKRRLRKTDLEKPPDD